MCIEIRPRRSDVVPQLGPPRSGHDPLPICSGQPSVFASGYGHSSGQVKALHTLLQHQQGFAPLGNGGNGLCGRLPSHGIQRRVLHWECLLCCVARQLAARVHLPPTQISGSPWPWSALLSAGEYQRLKAFKRAWLDADPDLQGIDFAFVSLSQNVRFVGTSFVNNPNVPTLLRSTILFRVVLDTSRLTPRLAVPIELLAMQMFPVNLPKDHFLSGLVPFEHAFAELSVGMASARALAGNGMNMAAVGAIILWALASMSLPAERHTEAESARS